MAPRRDPSDHVARAPSPANTLRNKSERRLPHSSRCSKGDPSNLSTIKTNEIRTYRPLSSRNRRGLSRLARALPAIRRVCLRHQRPLGLRHRQSQSLCGNSSRLSERHSCCCDWHRRLPFARRSGSETRVQDNAHALDSRADFLAVSGLARSLAEQARRLVPLLRDFPRNDFADDALAAHHSFTSHPAQTYAGALNHESFTKTSKRLA